MREFLLKMKAISDSLASVGGLILPQEHIDAILKGLPQDYHSVIFVIESKFEPFLIEEVDAMLLAHEARLQKFH